MRFSSFAVLLSTLALSFAQNVSLCDKYTTALLMQNNATNQYTLLTLLVNTVVIGNYTQPNKNAVPGILAKGTFQGQEVNLLPYFDGTLKSTNRSGSAVAVNFLDDGGPVPLKLNKPANSERSAQYFLLTHLYQFFGKLLGCSGYSTMGFPAYRGASMGPSHGFMNLSPAELGYFIQQVGLAATSFGVTTEDVTAVATALNTLFGYRCSPPTVVIPEMGATLNSICQNEKCPLDPMATCAAYPNNGVAVAPQRANATTNGTTPTTSTRGTASPTVSGPSRFTGAAVAGKESMAGLAVWGVAAFVAFF